MLYHKSIIVIGNANHHNTLSMVRCLGEAGFHVDLLCQSSMHGCAAKSKYVKQTFLFNSEEELIKLLNENYDDVREKYVIINCDDLSTHILDKHYEELKERFVFFNAGWEGRITEYQDKQVQTILAKKVGCLVPQSIVYSGNGKVRFDYYPCLVKPQESINGGKKILICDSHEEINSKIEQFADGNTVLIQQFISKDYEVVLPGMAWQGEVFIPGYIRKIRDNKGGTTYSEIHPICEMCSELRVQSETLIKEMGYEGLFGIEFIHNDNGFYFIEANLRNDATCYALAKAGANLPVAYAKAAKGEDVRELLTNCEVRQIRSMVELKDLKFVLKGKVSLWQWLKELREAECLFYYSKDDKKPLLYAILSIFMRVVPSYK